MWYKNINKMILYADTDEACSICIEKFKSRENVCKLSCQHLFHSRCVEKWLQNVGTLLCLRYFKLSLSNLLIYWQNCRFADKKLSNVQISHRHGDDWKRQRKFVAQLHLQQDLFVRVCRSGCLPREFVEVAYYRPWQVIIARPCCDSLCCNNLFILVV